MNKSLLCLSITSALALSGCGAGEEPYKELPKDEKQITTAAIEKAGERQYLYIRSVGQAPRYAAAIRGFTQGDPKLVSLAKTENGIQVRQIDRDSIGLGHDSRWQTDINQAPVLTIPGKYIDFKCTEDKWRECINEEEENKDADLTWDKKRYFIPQFEDAKVAEMNIEDIFTFGECVTETEDPRLVRADGWKGYEMDLDSGVINFEVEHTYQATMSCINQFYNGSLDNLSFTTTEYISIVAVDKLASPDYQAIPYSEDERGTYGYFTSDHHYRDATDSDGVDGYVRTYMNRFNPAKESITYYLSNNFFDAKNKAYLDAANESVTAINIQNKLFKTGFPEIKLEQANDKRHGDLRYSHITLFDQPLDNGLAGYGPSAANPLTGEIVSGRVNQYSSNLKQGAVRYYRQVRLDYNRGRLDAETATALTGVEYKNSNDVDAGKPAPADKVEAANFEQPEETLLAKATTLPKLVKESQEFDELVDYDRETRDYWSENTMMHLDNVYAVGGAARQLPAGIKDHKIDWKRAELWENGEVGSKLVAFETLPVGLQNELTTKLAAQAFAGTLTHELGHNFGLRHNFSGSTDKENLFTEEQMAMMDEAFTAAGYPDLTVNAEFSSQMDYNVNRFATTFEPYDLAALRFAYAREVEKKDGEFVSLKEEDAKRRDELAQGIVNGETRFGALYNVAQQYDLRSYNFCTDGHVTLNSNCNRSDAGGTLEEIADFYIERYQDSYETSNLRHNRQYLYEDHSLSYAVRRKRLFDDIRQFVEDVSFLEEIFSLPENYFAKDCAEKAAAGQDAWYCERQRAVDHASDLFLTLMGENDATVKVTYNWIDGDAVALQTSYNFADVLESYRFNSNDLEFKLQPGEVISQYSDSPEALKELILKSKINPNFQTQLYISDVQFSGRLLNGMKAPKSSPNHPYVNERDVLGVWPDKLLAVRALVSRTTPRSSTSRGYKALVDLPAVQPVFEDMLCKMVMADGPGLTYGGQPVATEFCGASGQLDKYLPEFVDFADQSIEPLPNYARSVARYFGFNTDRYGYPKGKSNLLEMILRQVKHASRDSDYQGYEKARKWREYVGVHWDDSYLDVKAKVAYNGRIYAATSQNVLAMKLMTRIMQIETFKTDHAALMDQKLGSGETVQQLLDGQLERDYRVLTYLPVL
ncbi:zinc-dependent metalloprotease [Ferrimonas sp.]|uniref:zinc-dependent metalloprotease n=1 Tax=Ferrimonas sp. TaxID=2080861 RepID=UPI003A8CAD3F